MRVSADRRLMRFVPLFILIFAISACTLPTSNNDSEGDTQITGAPIVQIASPLPNASYLEGIAVPIQISVSNAGADISRVDFTVDGTVIASPQNPNQSGALLFSLTQTWSATNVGQHQISVSAFRVDGTASTPATVTINVVDESALGNDDTSDTDTDTSTNTGDNDTNTPDSDDTDTDSPQVVQPTNTPAPTNTPRPTDPPVEPTSSVPTGTVATGVNIRGGPSTNFAVVATITANQTVRVVGLNLGGDWYKVVYNDSGSEGWILGTLLTVTGNTTDLPREAGPPTPVPPPPTQVPAPTAAPTAVPQAGGNLTLQQPFLDPALPQCGQAFTVGMTIANTGSTVMNTGLARINIVRVADGAVLRSSESALVSVSLQPGTTHRVTFTFTVDVYVNERQRVDFIVDVNNEVPESNDSDNRLGVEFTLGQGSCP